VLTNFTGGEKGTGVPFDFAKRNEDHKIKANPTVRRGRESTRLYGEGTSLGKLNQSSIIRERRIKRPLTRIKAPPPTGVRKIRIILLPVVIL
jgi:hypothetical protein